MNPPELVLLSAYQYPAQYAMTLAEEDMTCWLNGWTVLWHPALLAVAGKPPRVDSPYDHEQPRAGHIYALPESPPAYLPDDWEQRAADAGAVVLRVSTDRAQTVEQLAATLASHEGLAPEARELLSPPPDALAAYYGLAWGYLLLRSLAEAMEHENRLDPQAFWAQVQTAGRALANPEASWQAELRAAAALLQAAREILYPVTIHLLDLCVLDPRRLGEPWPATLGFAATNVIAATSLLEALEREHPARFEELRQSLAEERAEVCGGSYLEREDPLLPLDSQLWNLGKGLGRARELLGTDIGVFARRRFGFHPNLPLLVSAHGLTRMLFLTFDEISGLPTYTPAVIALTSPDGKHIDAYARAPRPADSADTYFNLGHQWYKTTHEDHAATLAFLHGAKPDAPWFQDLIELNKLTPLLGTWTTFTKFFNEVTASEFPPTLTADDFHSDYLSERVEQQVPAPVSAFASHQRLRRRVDACWTLAALHRAISAGREPLDLGELAQVEEQLELNVGVQPAGLDEQEVRIGAALAARLQARAAQEQPGVMLLNPCGFARRAVVELDGAKHPLAATGAVKACQPHAGRMQLVVEIPALGFLWLPRDGTPGTPPMSTRVKLGDQATRTIRNEFFEAEVDGLTGGLRAIRDQKTHMNRFSQQLVFNPGSRMVAKEVTVTSTGPALGEILSTGTIVGDQQQVLAQYRQRLRAWLGRPLLEMRIEIEPVQPAAGYAWHAYYGARFAWRDDRCTLVRGVGGNGHITTHPRPQTPDFFEVRNPGQNAILLTGGLPFLHRHGGRMADVILMPQGEGTTVFELGIALDREQPMQTALGFTSPVLAVPTTKGPPHLGASGWLFHVDAPNLLLSRMTPGGLEPDAPADAITARFFECASHSGLAEFRCVRNPKRAVALNALGQFVLQPNINDDVVHLEVSANDLSHVQVEFS